jgi:hypothetical protein
MVVRRGSRGEGCLPGRKSLWMSVECYLWIFLCRVIYQISEFGGWIRLVDIMFVVCIIIWHLPKILLVLLFLFFFGIKRFLWRYLYWLYVFLVTGLQQKIIWRLRSIWIGLPFIFWLWIFCFVVDFISAVDQFWVCNSLSSFGSFHLVWSHNWFF